MFDDVDRIVGGADVIRRVQTTNDGLKDIRTGLGIRVATDISHLLQVPPERRVPLERLCDHPNARNPLRLSIPRGLA